MADLKSASRWERYVPNLGENKSLEQPFYLRVRSNLTKQEFAAFTERYDGLPGDATPEAVAAALDGVVEMGDEPLSVQGQPVPALRDYIVLLGNLTGSDLIVELVREIVRNNSVQGTRELFYERLSGGRSGMGPAPRTAAASPGSGTKPSP